MVSPGQDKLTDHWGLDLLARGGPESQRHPDSQNLNVTESTGDYIQYLVITYNGKESEKQYICLTESLCCTPETNTLL